MERLWVNFCTQDLQGLHRASQPHRWHSPDPQLWAEVPTEPRVGNSASHVWAAGTWALSTSPGNGRAVTRPFPRGSCNPLLMWWEVSSIPAPELLLNLMRQALLEVRSSSTAFPKWLPCATARAVRVQGPFLCLTVRRTAATLGSCEPWHGGGEKAPVILPS